ncbi:MAG: glycosyltransferase family 4 protein [Ruminococcaceae bacterium]|nr:glycosyltransferase family 4 protein [Oscillospiraceae bacterium]
MNIIYLSSSCSDEKFSELREKGYTRKLPQAQKYHLLLREGIAQSIDGTVTSISAFPVNRQWTKRWKFPRETETVNGIDYVYPAFINANLFRQRNRNRGAKKEIKRIYRQGEECVIICDVLNHSIADAARACGKKYGIPVLGIVTDVPGYTSGARAKTLSPINRMIAKFVSKTKSKNLQKYDAYLFLTEEMNNVVNFNNRPYIVIEGHSDAKMLNVDNSLENKSEPKVAMYAGGIHKEFGIERMVNAFLKGDFDGWELHIYGDGNYQNDLTKVAAENPKVKYFGSQPNKLVVEKQLEASLLLNPRLTNAEYVKYSFPSKTMECMASGTPLLTTKLPGMPKDYYEYVYFFEDESEDGMLEAFKTVLSKSSDELYVFGKNAKAFVMNEKTNVKQAEKLMNFVCGLNKETGND